MRFYCTIFDKNYLLQGVTLFNSLKISSQEFRFYPLCMDDEAYNLLVKMKLDNMAPIKLDDLMTPELVEVQNRTTRGQFCWIMQPIICQYILDKFGADMVIYLEADSMFFSDPEIILKELGDDSISIVPHNFSAKYDNSEAAGKFCVQFNAFRNDKDGHDVLNYWKSECFKYSKENLLSYPGQTCLDNWPDFKGVKIIENIGAGVAPWNIDNFVVSQKDDVPCVNGIPVIFFHYHAFGFYSDGGVELGLYPLKRSCIDLIYGAYVRKLKESEELIYKYDAKFNFRRFYPAKKTIKSLLNGEIKELLAEQVIHIKRRLKGSYNIFSDEYFAKIRS